MAQLTTTQKYQEELYVFPYHYLDLASDYQQLLWSIEYLDLIKLVKNTFSPSNKKIVLDIGCGDGRLCYEIKKETYKTVGVDFSKKGISFARAFNPEVKFFWQNIEKLNIPMKFDVVILMESLEHFHPSKIPIILTNLSNVLKKDGKMIITVPSKNMSLTKKHFQHFTTESLIETLHPYFKIKKIQGYGKKNYHRKIFIFLRRIGCIIYSFRNQIYFIKKFLTFLNKYYEKNLSTGSPEECNGLIAICEKL